MRFLTSDTHSKSTYIFIYLSFNVLLLVFALDFDVVHLFIHPKWTFIPPNVPIWLLKLTDGLGQ